MQRPFATAWTFAEFGLVTLAFIPLLGAASLASRNDPTRRTAGRWMRNFGKTTTSLTPLWKFQVDGTPPADVRERPYVVVSNHESNADPFLLSWLPWDMRWLSKDDLLRLPVLGILMRFGGDITLKRGERESVKQAMDECLDTLKRGCSVMLFPEGTRSKDGKLLPFKEGAFRLAITAGVPVLPVALNGTRDCMRKGSAMIGAAHGRARILAPISTEGMTEADLPALMEQARAAIEDGVRQLRAEMGDSTPLT